MIHTSANFVTSYNNSTIEFAFGNICDSISRLGVPLFLMISGSLMLDEQRKFDVKKYTLRAILLLFVWSFFYAFIYYILVPFIKNESISLLSFFVAIIKGHYHLWYIYAICGLYLITPILRKFINKENKKIAVYFITLSILFNFTQPIIKLFLEELNSSSLTNLFTYIFDNLNLDFLCGLTSYYILGWLIRFNDFDKKIKVPIYIVGIISILLIILLTFIFPTKYSYIYSNSNILVALYSTSIFVFIKEFAKNKKSNKIATAFSNLSFGVYITHIIVLSFVVRLIPFSFNVFVYIVVVWLLTTVISYFICYIMSKIPIIQKLIKT